MADQHVQVELLDANGQLEGSFFMQEGQSFASAAEESGVSLPVSCCAGACFVCACKVKEGHDAIDIGLLSVPLVDIESDQVLTCVGGVKSDLFHDGQFHKIILQKLV